MLEFNVMTVACDYISARDAFFSLPAVSMKLLEMQLPVQGDR